MENTFVDGSDLTQQLQKFAQQLKERAGHDHARVEQFQGALLRAIKASAGPNADGAEARDLILATVLFTSTIIDHFSIKAAEA